MITPLSKQTDDHRPPPPSRGGIWLWVSALVFVGLFGLIAGGSVWWMKQHRIEPPYSLDTSKKTFSIGADIVTLPLNLVQKASTKPQQDRLNLTLRWPGLTGYSEQDSRFFLQPDRLHSLIFVTLEPRQSAQDMTGRLESVYVPLFIGEPKPGPAQLTLQSLQTGVGYDNELIAIHASDSGVWAARCEKPLASANPTCLRDFHAGKNLVVRYRFSTDHLEQWREIESAMRNSVNGWIKR